MIKEEIFDSLFLPDYSGVGRSAMRKVRRTGVPTDDPDEFISGAAFHDGIASVVGSSGNQFKAIVITDPPYNAVADGVLGAGTYPTGTDCTPAYNAAMAAAQAGQIIIIPAKCFFGTKPTAWSSTKRYVICLGDTYHAGGGCDFVDIVAPGSGAYRRHMFIHYGTAYGRINMPSHTKTNFDNNTGPDWDALIGNFIRVYNSNNNRIYFDQCEGFAAGISVQGESIGGVANGSQENKFYFNSIARCRYPLELKSVNGSSYCDKNHFVDGRLSGHIAIKIDGYEPAASNGEIWNGAFRSNTFQNLLIERNDYSMRWEGDVTYNRIIGCHIEGGTSTGTFAPKDEQIFWRKTNPNTVLQTSIISMETFDDKWFTNLGVQTYVVSTPIWYQGTNYIGSDARGDASGNFIIYTVGNFSQTLVLASNLRTKSISDRDNAFSQIASVAVTGVAETSLLGGGRNTSSTPPLQSNLPVGTEIILEGSGVVATANPPSGNIIFDITFGGLTESVTYPLTTFSTLNIKNLFYRIRWITRGTGTTAAGVMYVNIYLADEPEVKYTRLIASGTGFNTSSPSIDITARFTVNNVANRIDAYAGTIRFLKP